MCFPSHSKINFKLVLVSNFVGFPILCGFVCVSWLVLQFRDSIVLQMYSDGSLECHEILCVVHKTNPEFSNRKQECQKLFWPVAVFSVLCNRTIALVYFCTQKANEISFSNVVPLKSEELQGGCLGSKKVADKMLKPTYCNKTFYLNEKYNIHGDPNIPVFSTFLSVY